MEEILNIHLKLYDNITKCAKWSMMLKISEKVLPILLEGKGRKKKKIYQWFSDAIEHAWIWINDKAFDVTEYHSKFLAGKTVKYLGYFDSNKFPQADAAFNACLNTMLYTVEVMYSFAPLKTRKEFPIPPDVAQTDSLITIECLEWALKASEDKEEELAWQEKVINQLLQDHYTEEFDTLGELIGREYFEQFS